MGGRGTVRNQATKASNFAGGYKVPWERRQLWAKEVAWAKAPLLPLLQCLCQTLVFLSLDIYFLHQSRLYSLLAVLIFFISIITIFLYDGDTRSTFQILVRIEWGIPRKDLNKLGKLSSAYNYYDDLLKYRIWVRGSCQQSYSCRTTQVMSNQRRYPQWSLTSFTSLKY